MEVGTVGQGGQPSFDTFSKSSEINKINQPKSVQRLEVASESTSITNSSKDKPIREEEISKAVDKLNKFLEGESTHVEYSMHETFKDVMVKIVDNETGQVIVETPPKKILDMIAKMMELVGVMIDKKA